MRLGHLQPRAMREAAARLAHLEEARFRLQAVVPPDEWDAWEARAQREEQRLMALAIETTAAYEPGDGYRSVYMAAARGEKP